MKERRKERRTEPEREEGRKAGNARLSIQRALEIRSYFLRLFAQRRFKYTVEEFARTRSQHSQPLSLPIPWSLHRDQILATDSFLLPKSHPNWTTQGPPTLAHLDFRTKSKDVSERRYNLLPASWSVKGATPSDRFDAIPT